MTNLLELTLIRRPSPLWVQLGGAVILVIVFGVLRYALSDSMAGRSFVLLFLPVFLSSLLFGFRSGLLATALAITAAVWLWIEPLRSPRMDDPDDLLAAIAFLGICLAIVSLTEALRSALIRIASEASERELMLREINHRVRNDLQTITSMLLLIGLEGGRTAEEAQKAIRRVSVMGQVYDRLIQRDRTASVEAEDFIEGLVGDLRTSLVGARPVIMTVHVDPLRLTAPCATALGLIVNESVANAMKYAFPDDREGRIDIRLQRKNGQVVLTVQDNGVGFVSGSAPRGSGLGRRLIEQMVAQNEGSVEYTSEDGVTVAVVLPANRALVLRET